jgi:hypothetical protein
MRTAICALALLVPSTITWAGLNGSTVTVSTGAQFGAAVASTWKEIGSTGVPGQMTIVEHPGDEDPVLTMFLSDDSPVFISVNSANCIEMLVVIPSTFCGRGNRRHAERH